MTIVFNCSLESAVRQLISATASAHSQGEHKFVFNCPLETATWQLISATASAHNQGKHKFVFSCPLETATWQPISADSSAHSQETDACSNCSLESALFTADLCISFCFFPSCLSTQLFLTYASAHPFHLLQSPSGISCFTADLCNNN